MSDLPRVTQVGRSYLQRFADHEIYVYSDREPGRDRSKPGAGVSEPALERLIRDGLVYLGKPEMRRGRPVIVTDLGRAVLAAEEATHV